MSHSGLTCKMGTWCFSAAVYSGVQPLTQLALGSVRGTASSASTVCQTPWRVR